jgi:hypothetical protein
MPKYGPRTKRKVAQEMHEYKQGRLSTGSKGGRVKSRKQAVAIALSESRRAGYKVPSRGKKAE